MDTTLKVSDKYRAEYLEYYGVLPLELREGRLVVAAAGSPCPEVLEDLEEAFGAPLNVIQAARDDIHAAIHAHFSASESTDALVRSLDDVAATSGENRVALEADARDLANQPPVIRYVNLLLREAHEARASDVHIEAGPEGPSARFRIDGVLTEATPPPRALQAAVVSRLKLIADLDIAERRVPQDGRIRVRLDTRELDLRVSTLPTLFGESIVLRLLDEGSGPSGLEALGMPPQILASFLDAAARTHGIVLVTGPTGSGKTTTLYAALRLRNGDAEKIITIEDPVEYRLTGITQVPLNRKAGMTFAVGLRAILRQDPDVIMIGEMRDGETARIAVQAAMTGHIVFSTVHTNDAASATMRLVDLGVEPYMVADTLQGVLAQRLVRRICPHCTELQDPGPAFHRLAREPGDTQLSVGTGCASCRQTGYRGRVGIFEYIPIDDAIRSRLPAAASTTAVMDLVRSKGVTTMQEDGLHKVLAGLTTAEEVLRAVQA